MRIRGGEGEADPLEGRGSEGARKETEEGGVNGGNGEKTEGRGSEGVVGGEVDDALVRKEDER